MKKKKLFLGVFTTALIFTSTLVLQAKTESINIPVKYNNIKINVDGKQISTSNEPFIYNGVTYLPVRDVAAATGKTVNWDENTKTISLTSQGSAVNNNQNTQPKDNKASVNFGEFSVNIRDDFHITKDYQGRDAICVKYDFTNYGDKSTSFRTETYNKVFQDGIELERTFVSSDAIDRQYYDNNSKSIQKGTTILAGEFYVLRNKTSDVSIEVDDFSFFGEDKMAIKTLKISN